MVRAAVGWVLFALLLAVGVVSGLGLAVVEKAQPSSVLYFVVPHPDDEFQTWSLVEHSPEEYKVFILLTRGEETRFCESEGYATGHQAGLEPPAVPVPEGRWSDACEQARVNSLISYFGEMGSHDPTLPADFGDPHVAGPFPDAGGDVCRVDEATDCAVRDRTAEVWIDTQGRGAIIFFNLGDGDLSPEEVQWAVTTVLENRGTLGIDETLPDAGIIGTFANADYPCIKYAHPDHMAVHEALWEVDFKAGFQLGASCQLDPRHSHSGVVSAQSTEAAFSTSVAAGTGDEIRTGAHSRHYGWLHQAYYPVDHWTQQSLFHRHQYFWTRFNG